MVMAFRNRRLTSGSIFKLFTAATGLSIQLPTRTGVVILDLGLGLAGGWLVLRFALLLDERRSGVCLVGSACATVVMLSTKNVKMTRVIGRCMTVSVRFSLGSALRLQSLTFDASPSALKLVLHSNMPEPIKKAAAMDLAVPACGSREVGYGSGECLPTTHRGPSVGNCVRLNHIELFV